MQQWYNRTIKGYASLYRIVTLASLNNGVKQFKIFTYAFLCVKGLQYNILKKCFLVSKFLVSYKKYLLKIRIYKPQKFTKYKIKITIFRH